MVSEEFVYKRFDSKIKNEILFDIENFQKSNIPNTSINNKKYLYNEDSREAIDKLVDNNSIDLVITSPPYLNSRDYTDTYMLELKTLGFTKTLEEIQQLRKKTLDLMSKLNGVMNLT